MINGFKNTLAKVIHLRSIIGYNGMVFALKKTPVIGKLIPDRLYSTTFLKVIYWIFHVIKEVFKLFIGKFLGLGAIYLISWGLSRTYLEFDQAAGVSASSLYASFALLLFFLYALCGLLINRPYFKCTTEKEYLVFMLRMDAGKLNNTLFIYDLVKLAAGYFIAGLIALLTGAPFWLWLLIPVLAVFIKLMGTGLQAFGFRMKNKHHKPMKAGRFSITVRLIVLCMVLMMWPFLSVFIANGYYLPLPVMLAVSGVLVLLGVLGFIELKRFDSNLHRRALHDNINVKEIEVYKQPDTTKSFKKLKATGSVKDNKKGFEYLNALFMKRHGSMLIVKPVAFAASVLLLIALITGIFIAFYYKKFGAHDCANMVISNLLNMILWGKYEDLLAPFESDSGMEFLRTIVQTHMLLAAVFISVADNTFKSTQAMFINCDNSLMTFSFFKQREKIIKLFDIRLKNLIKINMMPSAASGLFANLLLFYTGGQDYPFHYLVNILICVLIGVIYNVIWLSMYYLFQPFTTSVNVRGGAYRVIQMFIVFGLINVCWIPADSTVLAGILFVLTALLVFVMRKLVYRFAPKTFKIHT